MKQFIVMSGMILLGVFIYQLILGPGEDSLFSFMAGFWGESLESRSRMP
jgi:hypothetical protein